MISKIKLGLSNAYLVREQGAILVDSGSPGEERKIAAALAKEGLSIGDLQLILHTHMHSDHVGSTIALQQVAGVPAAFHGADRTLAAQGTNGRLQGIGWRGRIMSTFFKEKPFDAPDPAFYVTDGQRLDAYGIAGTIIHTPGHTPGSISLVLDTGEAIIGDLLMGGFMGGNVWPGRPNLHYFGESMTQLGESLDLLLAQQVRKLYVGHGGPLGVGDVWAARSRISNSMAREKALREDRIGVLY